MQFVDGTIIVSATDLVGYLACDHLVTLELEAAAGRTRAADPRRSGARAHPATRLRARGGASRGAPRARAARSTRSRLATRGRPRSFGRRRTRRYAAMRAGRDVIFQATFFDGRWRGHADFLLRVDRPSHPRRLELRGRGHEARPAGQGGGAPPDVRLRGPARAAPGRRAGDDVCRDRRRRRATRTGSPTTRPTTGRSRPGFEARVFGDGAGPRDLPGARSSTARSAAGTASARTGVAPTTTCRSWRGSPARSAATSSRRERADAARARDRARRARRSRAIGQPALEKIREPGQDPAGRRGRRPGAARARRPGAAGPGGQRPVRRGLAAAARTVARRPLLRHRGGPVGARRRPRVPLRRRRRRSTARRASRALWGHDRAGEKATLRGVHRPRHRAPRRAIPTCTSTTTRRTSRRRSSGSWAATRPARTRSTGSSAAASSSTSTGSSARASASRRSRTRSSRSRSSTCRSARARSRRRLLRRRVRAVDGEPRRRRSSTGSRPTTATTASRRGCCATGSRATPTGGGRRRTRTPTGPAADRRRRAERGDRDDAGRDARSERGA